MSSAMKQLVCVKSGANCTQFISQTKDLQEKWQIGVWYWTKFIREKKDLCNKMFRLEQEGERLHKEFNGLERSQKQTLFKAKRYFDMLKEYENKLYSTKNCNKDEVDE